MQTNTHTKSHTHRNANKHKPINPYKHAHSLSLSLSLSHTHRHKHAPAQAHTHTHTHTHTQYIHTHTYTPYTNHTHTQTNHTHTNTALTRRRVWHAMQEGFVLQLGRGHHHQLPGVLQGHPVLTRPRQLQATQSMQDLTDTHIPQAGSHSHIHTTCRISLLHADHMKDLMGYHM